MWISSWFIIPLVPMPPPSPVIPNAARLDVVAKKDGSQTDMGAMKVTQIVTTPTPTPMHTHINTHTHFLGAFLSLLTLGLLLWLLIGTLNIWDGGSPQASFQLCFIADYNYAGLGLRWKMVWFTWLKVPPLEPPRPLSEYKSRIQKQTTSCLVPFCLVL